MIVSGNSLERIQQYVTIEQEPEPKEGGTPPAYWPTSGSLEVENLTARYSSVCIFLAVGDIFSFSKHSCKGRSQGPGKRQLQYQSWRTRRHW